MCAVSEACDLFFIAIISVDLENRLGNVTDNMWNSTSIYCLKRIKRCITSKHCSKCNIHRKI